MNDPESLKPVMRGIQLVLEEIRDIKRETMEIRRESAELRRESLEFHKEAQTRFDRYAAEAGHREKDLSRAIAVIGNIGRSILKSQESMLKNQRSHTELLGQILRAIRASSNGRNGNGHRSS